jgi:DNA-binding CsgD family transcriptional regulator
MTTTRAWVFSTSALATTLHIGEHTLRNHLSRIYDKLGVPNSLEL